MEGTQRPWGAENCKNRVLTLFWMAEWRRMLFILTDPNVDYMMELPRAWEPPGSSIPM